ncbi:hypothetical protein A3K86_02050 [Photobacterium jeanii]|uniref:Uncharacterized protein n=1 Tax=Photobacterium jeanii TaxID=858640 RepID=A0A178KL61_9GAMM|nr:hypothetical protein [Photobacterium jeanii]OAN17725.1 hypothetical protein A3K86_02050 [Photobacterium jeanii]PST92614.1 hypothetical protein C9I91_05425 [Photobacterium jeanii]
MTRKIILFFCFFWSQACFSNSNLQYKLAETLFLQNRYEETRVVLENIEVMSAESRYIYAKTFNINPFSFSRDEYINLKKSAYDGNINAIVSLTYHDFGLGKDLKNFITPILSKRATSGDNYAVHLLSFMDNRVKWLTFGADNGDGRSHYELYKYYINGGGFFFFDRNRKKVANKHLELSLDKKFNKAIIIKSTDHFIEGNYKRALKIITPLLNSGDADAILSLAQNYNLRFKQDKNIAIENAYYFYYIYNHFIGDKSSDLSSVGISLNMNIENLKKDLSIEQISSIESNAHTYISNHTVKYNHNKIYNYSLTDSELQRLRNINWEQ